VITTDSSLLGDRWAGLRPTAVNRILAEVHEVQASGRDVVSLMRGEPDFRTPTHIVAAATEALAKGRTGYPDNRGEPALRDAVAAKLSRDNGIAYDPATEILVTTGATFGIYAALMAVLRDGDEVLLPDPIYDAYQSPTVLAGGRVRPVRAAIREGRFVIDADALNAALTPRSRVLLLNSPWNPVGTVFTESELRAIGDFVVRHNLVLISDEIYEAIVYGNHRHVSPAVLSADIRSRTILVNSLSKTYAMTGWRVGYLAAPAAFISAMFLVLQQSSRGPATFIQDAAEVALAGPQQAVEDMRKEYSARRSTVLSALSGMGRVRALAPEGGFFSMVDARQTGVPSNDIRRRLLQDHGVVVAHGSAYGEGGEGTLRVSFASGGDVLVKGLQRLREGLASL
jgi:aspartate/methionine/tyrosine aminotransferase